MPPDRRIATALLPVSAPILPTRTQPEEFAMRAWVLLVFGTCLAGPALARPLAPPDPPVLHADWNDDLRHQQEDARWRWEDEQRHAADEARHRADDERHRQEDARHRWEDAQRHQADLQRQRQDQERAWRDEQRARAESGWR